MTIKGIEESWPRANVIGHGAKPWRWFRPTKYDVEIQEIGAYFQVPNKDCKITAINFLVEPSRQSNRFSGRLSSGILFEAGKSVTLSEITLVYGQPPQFGLDQMSMARNRIVSGMDVALDLENGQALYYPSKGIMFTAKNGTIARFAVMTCVSNSASFAPQTKN